MQGVRRYMAQHSTALVGAARTQICATRSEHDASWVLAADAWQQHALLPQCLRQSCQCGWVCSKAQLRRRQRVNSSPIQWPAATVPNSQCSRAGSIGGPCALLALVLLKARLIAALALAARAQHALGWRQAPPTFYVPIYLGVCALHPRLQHARGRGCAIAGGNASVAQCNMTRDVAQTGVAGRCAT